MGNTWREQVAPLIAQCVESGRAAGLDGRALWRYVLRSCPWRGEGHWVYKVWRDEAKVQCGLTPRREPGAPRRKPDAPGQMRMFD